MSYLKISYKTYVVMLLVMLSVVSIAVTIVNAYLEPLTGDLTRIGYYSENNYGWSGEQYYYQPALSDVGQREKYYDLVVIGDSFSNHSKMSQTPVGAYWTNALAQKTGLRIGVFHIGEYPTLEFIDDLLDRPDPPKFIVYQTIERELKSRLGHEKKCPEHILQSGTSPSLELRSVPAEPISYTRKKNTPSLDFGYSLKFILAQLTRHNFENRVVETKLSRGDLFSNRQSDHILFLQDDLIKHSWSETDWKNIYCNVANLQNRIQKNGKTVFLFLVAPDKSTIYSQFLSKQYRVKKPGLKTFENLNTVLLERLLISKVEHGEKDLYFPNDTHWSTKTHFIVAEHVAKNLLGTASPTLSNLSRLAEMQLRNLER